MLHQISVFAKELSDGGGGRPRRLSIEEGVDFALHLGASLGAHAAWSPILWRDDHRIAANFESASLVVADWEVTHERPFPHSLYAEPSRLAEFVRSLSIGDAPPADFVHLTEHGARLIWAVDRTVVDAEEYLELVQRLCLDVGGDLAATTLAAGFTSRRHLNCHPLMEISR